MQAETRMELRKNMVVGPVECGFESGMWTAPMFIAHVHRKFDIEWKTCYAAWDSHGERRVRDTQRLLRGTKRGV